MGGAKVSDKIAFINALLGEGRSPADRREDDLHVPEGAGRGRRRHEGGRRGGRRRQAAARRRSARRSRCRSITSRRSPTTCCRRRCARAPIPAGLRGRGHRPEDDRAVTRRRSRRPATVIWNGPVGWFEQAGVQRRARRASPRRWPTSAAVTVVGGGETAEAVEQFGFDDEDDARLDRRRGVPGLRRGQEVPESLAQIDDK